MSKVAIIIPCFNEASRLSVDSYNQFLSENSNIDIYFINDGSTDNTKLILNDITKSHKNSYLVDCSKNQGKSSAVSLGMIRAFENMNYHYIGFFDADLSTPLGEIFSFIKKLDNTEKLIMVSGCRVRRSGAKIIRNQYRHYFSRILITFINIYLNIDFYDSQTGAKLFRSKVIIDLFSNPFLTKWLFDVELILRIKLLFPDENYNDFIYEMPLQTWIEKKGTKIKLIDLLSLPIQLFFIKNHYKKQG